MSPTGRPKGEYRSAQHEGTPVSASHSDAPLLLVAYQCGPGLGSVSQIGWQWFTGMAARRAVHLVTHVRNRAAIEGAADRPREATITYVDTEWFAGPTYRLARRLFPRSEHAVFMLSQLDWFVFDAAALRTLRRLQRDGARWSLLHLVTPVTVSAPTRLHRLGVPVVRGPLNCGLAVPPGFEDLMRDDAMGLARLRVLPRLLEMLFGSLRHSRAVLVATAASRAALPRAVRSRCVTMVENAVDPLRFAAAPPAERHAGPLRLCFVGRLVAVKALPLLLEALARLRAEGRALQLEVVGDGPMAASWRAHADRLGLGDGVTWSGAMPAPAVAARMQACDVFCLPSVRESGGAVLLEAMACGRPVVAMDFGGPAEIVDGSVGWKVPMPDAATAVDGLAAALRDAQDDPAGRLRRGRRAAEVVRERHTWAAKMAEADALYARVLSADAAGARRPWRSVARSAAAPR
jgi:glycosyltransferase involved in cell wall biosynthesis